ncbi:MAG: class I SAM-dependent methyltransferase [Desulfobacteraceae bacterium]|nr:class I SAM-dependent methyltransferase [Desulfobacteraceae bacterium]
MTTPNKEAIKAGQAVYSRLFLSFYDFLILGIFCRFIWKCPSHFIVENYNQHISLNHLDVGVGTGYNLDKCEFPTQTPRLGLLDLNQNCLDVTGHRLKRYSPEVFCSDVFEPFDTGREKFDSIALNGLFHCIPGTMKEKGIVFDNAKQVLNPGGVVFGCTILNKDVKKGWAAKFMMKTTNDNKAFSNLEDGLDELKEELSNRFETVKINMMGCMALFSAK